MTNKYYLNKKNQKFLIDECDCEQEDMAQIQHTINRAKFQLYENDTLVGTITPKESIELLGVTDFLTGVARATFHWTACRYINKDKENYVIIDNCKMLSESLKTLDMKQFYL